MKALLQALVSGLLIGGIYALIALGLNIVFGTMRVVNFAQGTLLMAAMFMACWLSEVGGLHPYWSPLITMPLLFVGGYAIQRAFVSPLLARDRAREPMSVFLVTLGLALVLENVALALFSADFKTVQTDLSIATFKVQGLIVSVPRLVGPRANCPGEPKLSNCRNRFDVAGAINTAASIRRSRPHSVVWPFETGWATTTGAWLDTPLPTSLHCSQGGLSDARSPQEEGPDTHSGPL